MNNTSIDNDNASDEADRDGSAGARRTRARIEALGREATAAGDGELAALYARALRGDPSAMVECLRVLDDAAEDARQEHAPRAARGAS